MYIAFKIFAFFLNSQWSHDTKVRIPTLIGIDRGNNLISNHLKNKENKETKNKISDYHLRTSLEMQPHL